MRVAAVAARRRSLPVWCKHDLVIPARVSCISHVHAAGDGTFLTAATAPAACGGRKSSSHTRLCEVPLHRPPCRCTSPPWLRRVSVVGRLAAHVPRLRRRRPRHPPADDSPHVGGQRGALDDTPDRITERLTQEAPSLRQVSVVPRAKIFGLLFRGGVACATPREWAERGASRKLDAHFTAPWRGPHSAMLRNGSPPTVAATGRAASRCCVLLLLGLYGAGGAAAGFMRHRLDFACRRPLTPTVCGRRCGMQSHSLGAPSHCRSGGGDGPRF